MSAAVTPLESTSELDALDQCLVDHHLEGSWMRRRPRSTPLRRPEAPTGPRRLAWRWAELRAGLLESGNLVGIGPGQPVEMRTVRGEGSGRMPVVMDAQILLPGEHTRGHFNMKNETRLVVEAPDGAVFVCDGEPFAMERGDVIVSPSWSYHDHYNGGSTPAVWIDGFDTGYSNLGAELNTRLPEDDPYQEIRRTGDFSLATLGRLRAGHPRTDPTARRPVARYPYAETAASLGALRDAGPPDPYDGYRVLLVSPVDGGPTLPTMAWHAQVLPPQFAGSAHRHNSTAFYHVFVGEGSTVVDGERLDWTTGDLFAVPAWTWHAHHNESDADVVLYSIDDWPARTALGFYASEVEEPTPS